ncbi:hypothetical protein [Zavarzinella formosa]|uniref:hypothetical protein n=1 Tax=Zavarzinella formosa TaxID=360055 RepID=UPI000310709F|nr:hypothetical protein [Zavarzinella formosa]
MFAETSGVGPLGIFLFFAVMAFGLVRAFKKMCNLDSGGAVRSAAKEGLIRGIGKWLK